MRPDPPGGSIALAGREERGDVTVRNIIREEISIRVQTGETNDSVIR